MRWRQSLGKMERPGTFKVCVQGNEWQGSSAFGQDFGNQVAAKSEKNTDGPEKAGRLNLALRNPCKEMDPVWSERLDYKNVKTVTPLSPWKERNLKLKQPNGSIWNIWHARCYVVDKPSSLVASQARQIDVPGWSREEGYRGIPRKKIGGNRKRLMARTQARTDESINPEESSETGVERKRKSKWEHIDAEIESN